MSCVNSSNEDDDDEGRDKDRDEEESKEDDGVGDAVYDDDDDEECSKIFFDIRSRRSSTEDNEVCNTAKDFITCCSNDDECE